MKARRSISRSPSAPPLDVRVVLLDAKAERRWMEQSSSGEWIRCIAGDWRFADEWLVRALASPLTASRCMEWVAARLGIGSLTCISMPLRERFAERLIAFSGSEANLAARLCLQVLGWGPPARLNRFELWEGFAGFTPTVGLPRIVTEGDAVIEQADRMALAGVPVGLRVDPLFWEQFLTGNDWRRHTTRWRLAPVLGEGRKEEVLAPIETTRRLVRAVAPDALLQFDAALTLVEKEKEAAVSGKGSGEARSAAEALLFSVLDARPLTRGRFRLNASLDFPFGTRPAEGDLVAHDARLVVEIDGYFHFRDSEDYRRDRRKDAALQQHGWFVLRFLAADIVRDLEGVLARIDAQLARLTSFPNHDHIKFP